MPHYGPSNLSFLQCIESIFCKTTTGKQSFSSFSKQLNSTAVDKLAPLSRRIWVFSVDPHSQELTGCFALNPLHFFNSDNEEQNQLKEFLAFCYESAAKTSHDPTKAIPVKLLVAYLAPRTAWSSVDRVIAYFPDSNPLPQDRHALDKSGYPIFLHSNDRSFLFDQMIMDDHRLPLLHEFWKSIYDTVLTDGNSLCHDQPSPPPPLEMISTNSSLSESLQPASSSSAVESWTFDQGYPQDLHQAPFLYDRQVRRYTMVQSIKMFLNDTLAIEFHNFIEPDVSGLVSSTAEQVQSSSSSVRSNLLITADASTMTESVADDENNLKATLDNVHQVPEVITNQHRQQQSSSPPPPSSSSSSSFSSSQPLQPIISTNSTTQEEDLLDQNTSSVSNQPISTTKPAPPYTLQVSSSSPMRQSSKDSTESSPELQFDISYYLQQQDSLIDNKSSNSINDTPIIFMDESKVRLVRMMSTEHDMVVMEEKEKEEEVVVRPPADQQAFSQLHPQHQHAATSTTSLPLKINQVDRPISQDEYVTQSGFMQQDEITSAVSQAQPNTATTTSVASAVAAATLEELEVQEESSTAHAHITSQDGQQVFLASPHDSEFPLFDLTAISCLDEGGIYNNTSPSFSLKRKFDQGEGGKQEIVAGVSLSSIITTAAAAAAPTLLDDHHHHNNGISLDNLSPSNILSMQPFESQDASRYSKEQQRQRHLSLDDDDLFGVGAGSTCLSILPFDSPTRPNNWVIPNLAGGDGGGDWNGVADETNFNAANDSASGGDFGNNNNEDVSMILVDQSMDDQIPETLDNGTNESFLIPSTTRNLVDSQEMEEHDNILFLQASMQMFADSLFANPNAYCESQVAATDFPYHHHQQQQHTAQNELVLVPETQMSEADDGAGHTGGEGDSQEMTEEWQPPTTFTIPQPIPSAETDFMTDSMLLMDQEIVDCSLTPLETIKSQLAAAASSTTTRDSSKLPSSPCVNILCIITSIPSCVQHVQIKKGYFSNQSVAVSNIEVADETLASRVVYINLWRDKADWIDTKFGGLDLGDVIFVTNVRFNMFMEKMCGNLSHDSELHLIDRKCKSGYSWPTRELDYARAVSSRFKSRLFSLIEWAGRQAIFKAINRKNPIQGPPPPPPENANVEVPLAMTNTLQVRSSKRNGLVSLRARIASIKFQSVSFPLPNTTSPSQLVTQLLNLVKLYCSVCEIVVNPDRNGIYHCSGPIGGKGCQESWGKPKKLEWRLATPEFQLCSVRSMITRNPPLNAVKVPLGVFERVVGISPKDFMEAVWADADARIKAEVDEVLLSQPLIEGDDEEEKNGSVKESSVPPSNATLAIAEEFGRKCNGLINNDTFFKFILRIRREQDIHGFLSSQRIEIVNMENTE